MNDTIKFDWAYALRTGYNNDRLVVKVSTDGGTTFPYTVFDKQGSVLGTAPATTSSFVPAAGQWGTFAVSISNLTNINPVKPGIPVTFELCQNYPNPFNPVTKIEFSVPFKDNVKFIVYDILGKEIKTLINEPMDAGFYSINFDAGDLPSGIYFYRMETHNFMETKKMLLIK